MLNHGSDARRNGAERHNQLLVDFNVLIARALLDSEDLAQDNSVKSGPLRHALQRVQPGMMVRC
jgi:hypothetical protein